MKHKNVKHRKIISNRNIGKSKSKELIPNFEKGEFYLADYLNKKLPKEWNIYTRPELKARWGSNQNKKTPDIVVRSSPRRYNDI